MFTPSSIQPWQYGPFGSSYERRPRHLLPALGEDDHRWDHRHPHRRDSPPHTGGGWHQLHPEGGAQLPQPRCGRYRTRLMFLMPPWLSTKYKHGCALSSVRRGDVLAAWSGIRPLVTDPNSKDTQSICRNHIVSISDTGLITIAGQLGPPHSFKTLQNIMSCSDAAFCVYRGEVDNLPRYGPGDDRCSSKIPPPPS